jgi:hypothetical protein
MESVLTGAVVPHIYDKYQQLKVGAMNNSCVSTRTLY